MTDTTASPEAGAPAWSRHNVGTLAYAFSLTDTEFNVVSEDSRKVYISWCNKEGLGAGRWEALEVTKSREFMSPTHENPPHMGTVIRRTGAGLDGLYTTVTIYGHQRFRYPVEADPRETGVQEELIGVGIPADTWGPTRSLTVQEAEYLFSPHVTRS